jgi:hypothetical protein
MATNLLPLLMDVNPQLLGDFGFINTWDLKIRFSPYHLILPILILKYYLSF